MPGEYMHSTKVIHRKSLYLSNNRTFNNTRIIRNCIDSCSNKVCVVVTRHKQIFQKLFYVCLKLHSMYLYSIMFYCNNSNKMKPSIYSSISLAYDKSVLYVAEKSQGTNAMLEKCSHT